MRFYFATLLIESRGKEEVKRKERMKTNGKKGNKRTILCVVRECAKRRNFTENVMHVCGWVCEVKISASERR